MKKKLKDFINMEYIEKYIDKVLKNDKLNNKLIPDYIEKKLYTNVFKIALHVMNEIFENTHFGFLDYKLKNSIEKDKK